MKMHQDVGGQKVTKLRITINIMVKSGSIQTFSSDFIVFSNMECYTYMVLVPIFMINTI